MRKRKTNSQEIRIAVDIDETIISSFFQTLQILSLQTSKSHEYDKLTNHEWHLVDNIPWTQEETNKAWDEAHRKYREYNTVSSLVTGAQEGLKKLKNAGCHIVAITGRGSRAKKATKDLLDTHFPGIFSWVYFNDYHKQDTPTKGEIGNQHAIDFAIDDNPEFAASFAHSGIHTYMLTRPWNEQAILSTHLERVNSWEEITNGILSHIEKRSRSITVCKKTALMISPVHALTKVEDTHELMLLPEHQELICTDESHSQLCIRPVQTSVMLKSQHTALTERKIQEKMVTNISLDKSLVVQEKKELTKQDTESIPKKMRAPRKKAA